MTACSSLVCACRHCTPGWACALVYSFVSQRGSHLSFMPPHASHPVCPWAANLRWQSDGKWLKMRAKLHFSATLWVLAKGCCFALLLPRSDPHSSHLPCRIKSSLWNRSALVLREKGAGRRSCICPGLWLTWLIEGEHKSCWNRACVINYPLRVCLEINNCDV